MLSSLGAAEPVGSRTTVVCDITEGFGVVTQDLALRDDVGVAEFGERVTEAMTDRGYRILDLHGAIARGSLPVEEDWYMALSVYEGGTGDVVMELGFRADDCSPDFFPNFG